MKIDSDKSEHMAIFSIHLAQLLKHRHASVSSTYPKPFNTQAGAGSAAASL